MYQKEFLVDIIILHPIGACVYGVNICFRQNINAEYFITGGRVIDRGKKGTQWFFFLIKCFFRGGGNKGRFYSLFRRYNKEIT